MSATASCPEEGYHVYWKIKNFSYCCEAITSPEFSFNGSQYSLQLLRNTNYIECRLILASGESSGREGDISFLTCDGSLPEESNLGDLRVPKDVIFRRPNSFLVKDTLTLRLQLKEKGETGKLFICSKIGVKRIQFVWTIPNFSNYEPTTGKCVEKSKLYGNIVLNLKFMSAQYLYFEISRTEGEKCYCVHKLSVLDVDGKAVNEVKHEFVLDKNGLQTSTVPAFIKKIKLIACRKRLLPNDSLTLKCHFAISLGTVTDHNADVSYCEYSPCLNKEFDNISMTKETNCSESVTDLQVALERLLKNETLCDASLKFGAEVLKVHKSILSARSPVFEAMFTKDMKEAINNTVLIEDIDIETARSLIAYIYTNSISEYEWDHIKSLYYAAEKYQVLCLKKKCRSFLSANLSISNACEALVFADLHYDDDLKIATVNFIYENDSLIFTSKAWEELGKNNSSLALEVINEIYLNKTCFDIV